MKKISILLLVIFSLFLIGCKSNKNIVNLGILRVPNDAILAKQMGLFEDKFGALGYQVEYYYFDSGVDANKAIVSGDIDFATMGNINALIALGTNLDAELIWIHETLGEVEALAVRDNAGIESVSDLAGKSVATTFGSTSHYILLNILKDAGIENQVTLLDMKTDAIVASWLREDIDAAYTWQPSLGELLNHGGSVLLSSEDMIEEGYMTANVELARKSFATTHPELVKAYIECMSEAYDYFTNHHEDAINKLATELELTVADVELQTSGSLWISLTEMQSDTFFSEYISTMYAQTSFLADQDIVTRVISRDEVVAFMNNSYALGIPNE